jgi:aminoglycoside phosphotransferase (APT) family kinase protein
MVHADLKPDNVLVRDGAVVAVVDIGNAGSGTRATDLTTLQWYTFEDPLEPEVGTYPLKSLGRQKCRTTVLDRCCHGLCFA